MLTIMSWTIGFRIAALSDVRCCAEVLLVPPQGEVASPRCQGVGQQGRPGEGTRSGGGIEPTGVGQRCAAHRPELARASPEGLDAPLLWTMFGGGDCRGIGHSPGDGEKSPARLAEATTAPLVAGNGRGSVVRSPAYAQTRMVCSLATRSCPPLVVGRRLQLTLALCKLIYGVFQVQCAEGSLPSSAMSAMTMTCAGGGGVCLKMTPKRMGRPKQERMTKWIRTSRTNCCAMTPKVF